MNLTDELERLHDLHQSGALTAEEFAQAKSNLLGGRPTPDAPPPQGYYVPAGPPLRPQPLDPVRMEQETRQWALMLHLSVLAGCIIPFGGIAAVLLIWQLKKNELPGIEPHAKMAMNWAISQIIYGLFCLVLILTVVGMVIGIPLAIAVYVVGIIFPIMAALKANNGELWKYPLSIEFLK